MGTCATTCPYCGVGCGVTVEVDAQHAKNASTARDNIVSSLAGDQDHPANAGRLCVKGTALAETLSTEGRLLFPQRGGERLAWDNALDLVATRLRETRDAYGPGAIAFYLSGQLLTEDYYVANKLMKGFLGSANVDTNSRLCMSSAVAAYQRAFGEDVVPCTYDDLETCDLLLMVGSNAAWTHPVIYQRIVASKAANPAKRIVVIDTRRTATAELADLFLQITPGSDSTLFGGLLRHLAQSGALDSQYIAAHTSGFDAALAAVQELDETSVCDATGLSRASLQQFYEYYADTAATVSMYSQGINQSATGTDNCNAIINCHLATGRIGKPGAGPFSITGQPNAMGGREVGGLANQLAAHRRFTPGDVAAVGDFWQATDMASAPGLKAVDLFQAAASGDIKFLWIMATNPAVSLPDSAQVAAALKQCDFVVVSDCTANTDTARLADLLLPAAGWGEKAGTVTNSERVISRQRQFLPPPGEAQPDWWIVSEVARRMGHGEAFDYSGPAEIFREHAALSGHGNTGERCFDISGLKEISDAEYEAMTPQRWPVPDQAVAPGHAAAGFSGGRFSTEDGRARFVPVKPLLPQAHGKLIVNSGRLRDQWHSMTRTGAVPRLTAHRDFFGIWVHPEDARAQGIEAGDLARLHNQYGDITGVVTLDNDLPRGQTWVPIHWNAQFASGALVNSLVAPVTDPFSGQPQLKFAAASLQKARVASWALLFTRTVPELAELTYWSRMAVQGGYVTLVAHHRVPREMFTHLKSAVAAGDGEAMQYHNESTGEIRQLAVRDGSIDSLVFIAPARTALPDRRWIGALGTAPLPATPHQLLAGCNPMAEDTGTIICSCWEVGEKQISSEITCGATTAEELGERLRCGTQCGSCIPELKRLLRDECRERAA